MAAAVPRVLTRPLVLGLLVLQIASYAALLAVFSIHGEASPAVAALRGLPTPLLVVLSLPAVPAAAVSVALAEALRVATGLSPFDLGTVLLTPGDALVFLTAYLLSVGAAVVVRRARSRAGSRARDPAAD